MAYESDGGNIRPIRIENSTMLFMVDTALELERAKKFVPLILKHSGCPEPRIQPFPYASFSPSRTTETRCFDAAFFMARKYGLRYVEGIVSALTLDMHHAYTLVPMAHAWCVDGHNGLVDPTLHKTQHSRSLHYLGVPIKLDYAAQWHERVGYYGCLDGPRDDSLIGVHHESPDLWLDTPKDWFAGF